MTGNRKGHGMEVFRTQHAGSLPAIPLDFLEPPAGSMIAAEFPYR